MVHHAGDELPGGIAEAQSVGIVAEDVRAVVPGEGHINVHPRTVDAENGLGHEGGVQAGALGNGFHHELEGHHIIGCGKGLAVFEVDLVLGVRHLVVGGLYLEAHILEGHADIPPHVFPEVDGAEVEIAALVVRGGGGSAEFIGMEQEEFQLRAHVEVEAHIRRLLDHAAQAVARVALEGGAVRHVNIADEAGNLALLGPPGEDHEGIEVGVEVHIRFLDAHEPLDGGAVEHALILQRFFKLTGGDGHVFELAENVCELEADEFHIVLLTDFDDLLLGILHGGQTSCFLMIQKGKNILRKKKQ